MLHFLLRSFELLHDISKSVVASLHPPPVLHTCLTQDFFRCSIVVTQFLMAQWRELTGVKRVTDVGLYQTIPKILCILCSRYDLIMTTAARTKATLYHFSVTVLWLNVMCLYNCKGRQHSIDMENIHGTWIQNCKAHMEICSGQTVCVSASHSFF